MVAAVGAWGDFRRGEEAGDEPRGQRTCLWILRCSAAAALLGRFLRAFRPVAGLSLWRDSVSGGRSRAAGLDLDIAAGYEDLLLARPEMLSI